MDDAWDNLDEDWKKLEKLMVSIGITKPVSLDGGLVHLNVGGEHLNVRRAVLESMHEKHNKQRWRLANVFDGLWDSRIPRDKDGRIVLDESPVIMKHLVHTQIKAPTNNQVSGVSKDLTTSPPLSSDQRPYLQYVSSVLGLQDPIGMQIIGGSTVLKEDELDRLGICIQSWCPGDPKCLELIYRGSRDGLTSNAFHSKCGDKNPSTVTLVKVHQGSGSSVVGGFSSVSWATQNGRLGYYEDLGYDQRYCDNNSPDAFIFMVKDGSAERKQGSQPVRWTLPKGPEGHAVVRGGDSLGPDFGDGGYRVTFGHYPQNPSKLHLGNKHVSTSPFRNLGGKNVSEVEVYVVRNEARVIASDDLSNATEGSTAKRPSGYAHTMDVRQIENTRLFGASIAGALMEEGTVLHDAQVELALAVERIEAAGCALEAVYGPDIAIGKPDPVVELNLHGTRMTTLRSTLQACPESALAARFDDSKWPSDGKDFGVIDCSPPIFSKVLDVLRMRKRVRWSKHNTQQRNAEMKFSRVVITSGDRTAFKEFVDMYFPGCEASVMDWVQFQSS